MKCILFTVVLLASCNSDELSKQDKAAIEMGIQLHNINAKQVFETERRNAVSMHVTSEFVLNESDSALRAKNEQTDKDFLRTYFEPYMIERDTALTFEKYMAWCNRFKVKDRVKYLDEIDPRGDAR